MTQKAYKFFCVLCGRKIAEDDFKSTFHKCDRCVDTKVIPVPANVDGLVVGALVKVYLEIGHLATLDAFDSPYEEVLRDLRGSVEFQKVAHPKPVCRECGGEGWRWVDAGHGQDARVRCYCNPEPRYED